MISDGIGVRRVLATFAIGALLSAGSFCHSAGAQDTPARRAEAEALLDSMLVVDPTMTALSHYFPAEWAVMRRELVADIVSTMPISELEARAHGRTRSFMMLRAGDIAQAPTPALQQILRSEVSLIGILQAQSVQHCADFATRGLQPGAEFSGETIRQLGVINRMKIEAAFQGARRPAARTQASEQDWLALLDILQGSGASAELIETILAGGEGSPPALVCEGAVALYQGMAALPAEQGARVYASTTVEAADIASVSR